MQNFTFFGFLTFFLISSLLCLYNIVYAKEVRRIERNIGITAPKNVHTLLKSTTMISFGLCLVITVLTLFALLTKIP